MLDLLADIDIKLFYLINHFHVFILDLLLPLFSKPDFIYIFYSITGSFLLLKYSIKKSLIIYLFFIIGFLWVDFSCAKILKPYFQRKRPFVSINKVYYYSEGSFQILDRPLNKHTSYSFPSNHASNVGYASSFLSFYFPKVSFLWILFALIVGWSRIYLGVHFPSDILAGYFYGFFWAFIFYQITKLPLRKW